MAHVPDFAKNFLRTLPNAWDDVKFIDGYPGKLAVIARRSGSKWYVAGINGENISKNLTLDLSLLKNKKVNLITHNSKNLLQEKVISIPSSGEIQMKLEGNDGFVMIVNN